MSYGFRLFKVEMTLGPGGWKPLPFDRAGLNGGVHAAQHIDRLLSILETYATLSKMPVLKRAADDVWPPIDTYEDTQLVDGDPRVRWLSHTVTGGNRVSFVIKYGKVGKEAIAMSKDDLSDADIRGKAPAQDFRGDLYFPATGEVAILALEAIDRHNPVKVVSQWIARAAIEAYLEDLTKKSEAEEFAAENSLTVPALKPANHRLRVTPLPDYARLERMIANGDETYIRLTKHVTSPSGVGKSVTTKYKFESTLTTVGEKAAAVDWAKSVYRKAVKKDSNATATVAELEEIAGENVSALGFDEGVLVVKKGNDTTKIAPDKLDDIFVYPITENIRPDDVQWRQAVEKEIVSMRTALGIEVALDED